MASIPGHTETLAPSCLKSSPRLPPQGILTPGFCCDAMSLSLCVVTAFLVARQLGQPPSLPPCGSAIPPRPSRRSHEERGGGHHSEQATCRVRTRPRSASERHSAAYAACRRSVVGPGEPLPMRLPSTLTTGVRPPNVPVTKASSAPYTCRGGGRGHRVCGVAGRAAHLRTAPSSEPERNPTCVTVKSSSLHGMPSCSHRPSTLARVMPGIW